MLTHFDANAGLVSGPIVICMIPLLQRGHVLDGNTVLHGEMPDDPTKGSVMKRASMSIGVPRVVLSTVDRDVLRPHGAKAATHEIPFQPNLSQHAASACACPRGGDVAG